MTPGTRFTRRTAIATAIALGAGYNHDRPHEMLAFATPGSRYRAGPRPFPTSLPIPVYADDVLVRRVSKTGAIRFQHRHLPISEGLAGHDVGLRPTTVDGTFEILFHQQVVRVITLDALPVREG